MRRLAAFSLLVVGCLVWPAPAVAQQDDQERLHQWVRHIIELEGRVARHGDSDELMIRLTNAYVRVGDVRRALPAFERLADMGVDPVRIALLQGDLHLFIGEYDQATRCYLEALSHCSIQTYALSQLWQIMLQVTMEQSQVDFDRQAVVETLQRAGLFFPIDYAPEPDGPSQAVRLVDRANTLMMRRRPEEALALLMQAITLDPANSEAFGLLGRAHEATNDSESAVGAFLVYLLLSPEAPDTAQIRQYIGRQIHETSYRPHLN